MKSIPITRAELSTKMPVDLHDGKPCTNPNHEHNLFVIAGSCCRSGLVYAFYNKAEGTILLLCSECGNSIMSFEVK